MTDPTNRLDPETSVQRHAQVREHLDTVLANVLRQDVVVTDATVLTDELGLSSSAAVYLLLELEEELDIHIPVEDLYREEIRTVGDLTDYIVARWDPVANP